MILVSLGVDFLSCTEPFDTCTSQGRLMLHLVSAFSELERGVLIERTKSASDEESRLRLHVLPFVGEGAVRRYGERYTGTA